MWVSLLLRLQVPGLGLGQVITMNPHPPQLALPVGEVAHHHVSSHMTLRRHSLRVPCCMHCRYRLHIPECGRQRRRVACWCTCSNGLCVSFDTAETGAIDP